MPGPWLYPISEGEGRNFDLAGDESIPVSTDSFRALVADGRIVQDRYWYISQHWNNVEVGDEVFIYTGEADLGIIGYFTVGGVEQRGERWCIVPRFDLARCRALLDNPVPAALVREWVFPRRSVINLEAFKEQLRARLPWATATPSLGEVSAAEGSSMPFVTYENYRNPHVTIHVTGCSEIGKRGGKHKYDQGGYRNHATYPAAREYAESTRLRVILCSRCKPVAGADGFHAGISGRLPEEVAETPALYERAVSRALTNPGDVEPASAADANDYAIENRKIEIEQRQKQSLFRQRVMQNFEGRCCLSEISEEDLLVAGHIVPWAKRIDTRLDPSNGLLLYCPYDRLFDKGFISLDDELRVVVIPWADQCSPALRAILKQLAGQRARLPVKWPIKAEYLAYHRTEILQTEGTAAEGMVVPAPG